MIVALVPQMMGLFFGHGWMMRPYGFGFRGLPVLLVLLVLFLLIRRARHRRAHHGGTGYGRPAATPPRPTTDPGAAPEAEAMRILADRLAAGDITPEDYQARVNTLRSVRDQGDPLA
ncbi:SHOCT domain-containing protein [Raineyella fluvialis]|uniref:Uncharacterized protein n=1 Tax=Raineyella fluvialis TaxID=2662261 RepID=A0A5Q2FDE7_9ACTN|nr:SHOCT domain-containing protein [Raineyella fluvialis]QGF23454.1 hypothetical protein Rai3103_06995 [Raineyella fluvialis]